MNTAAPLTEPPTADPLPKPHRSAVGLRSGLGTAEGSVAKVYQADAPVEWLRPQAVMAASWGVVGLGGVIAGISGIDTALGPWLWVFAGCVVGLAHGACDAMDAPASRLRRIAWWLGYGVIIAALTAVAFAYPAAAIAGFLLLTVWHFGASDYHDLVLLSPDGPRRLALTARWLSGFGRMGLFFGAMGAAQPAAVAEVGTAVAAFFAWSTPVIIGPEQTYRFSWALIGIAIPAYIFGLLWRQLRLGPGGPLTVGVLETGALVSLAIWLDPLFVVGLYFLGWHAPRRIARQLRDSPTLISPREPQPNRIGQSLGGVARYHLRTAWLWLPIWPAWAFWVWQTGPMNQAETWAAGLIALFVVLTPVHHLLGERAEAQRRLFGKTL
ncbi:MAG: Brp/Blh family beta-carotene 15,15'-dioxygenase [Planctomycetota bacterium]